MLEMMLRDQILMHVAERVLAHHVLSRAAWLQTNLIMESITFAESWLSFLQRWIAGQKPRFASG